jgi:hypothetical protein
MIPHIIVTESEAEAEEYVSSFSKNHAVKPHNIERIFPEKKELGIGQVRQLQKAMIYSSNEVRVYVVYWFDTASIEAQNAFLKTLEEPVENSQLILVVKSASHLLPTVLSRVSVISLSPVNGEAGDTKAFDTLLDDMISLHHLKPIGDPLMSTKSKENPADMLSDFIAFFRKRLERDPKAAEILRAILAKRILVEHNNVDAQNAVDSILIQIYSTYKPARS